MDEACANVIEHAYGSDTTREVTVKATIDADAVQIRIVDTGRGFDPTNCREDRSRKPDQPAQKRRPGNAADQVADGRSALRDRAGPEERAGDDEVAEEIGAAISY